MSPPPARTGSRVAIDCSRPFISNSRALIASAKAVIAHSHQALACQSYVRIVCAWCQETIRLERSTVVARGQTSHSICLACLACFAHVFPELNQRA